MMPGSLKILPGFFKRTCVQSGLCYFSALNPKFRLRFVMYLAADKSYAKGNIRTTKWWCVLFLKAASGCPGHISKHQIAWSTWRLWIFLWTDVCGLWPLVLCFACCDCLFEVFIKVSKKIGDVGYWGRKVIVILKLFYLSIKKCSLYTFLFQVG